MTEEGALLGSPLSEVIGDQSPTIAESVPLNLPPQSPVVVADALPNLSTQSPEVVAPEVVAGDVVAPEVVAGDVVAGDASQSPLVEESVLPNVPSSDSMPELTALLPGALLNLPSLSPEAIGDQSP